MNDSEKVLNHEWVIKTVQTVMDDYDFMILLERLDECLVLMQLILGVDTKYIFYPPATNISNLLHIASSYDANMDQLSRAADSFANLLSNILRRVVSFEA